MLGRKGSAIVLFAAGLTTFLMFLALVIDVGFWYTRRAQVQLNGDLAVLTAMGSLDPEASLATQKAFIANTTAGILKANGYDDGVWSVDPQGNTTGGMPNTYVGKVIATATTVLPTFFLNVWTTAKPVMRTVSAAEGVRQKASLPPCGFIAKNLLRYGGGGGAGGRVDSFNSDFGGYAPQNQEGGQFYDEANAVGCANAGIEYNGNVKQYGSLYSMGNIVVSGGAAIVDGNAEAGGTVSAQDGVVTGMIKNHADVPRFLLPPVVPPANIGTAAVNDNDRIRIYDTLAEMRASCPNGVCSGGTAVSDGATTLAVAGGKVVAMPAGGRYYFTDLKTTGNSAVVIVGDPDNPPIQHGAAGSHAPTRLYIDGDMDVTGGIEFNAALEAPGSGLGGITARDFEILGLAGADEIHIGGGSKIVADIYAPSATVALKGSQHTFGRMRASDIEIDGVASFTFDEALGYGNVDTDSFVIKVHLVE
jgi:hypothetical protein